MDACRKICSTVDSAKLSLNDRLHHVETLHQKSEEERLRFSDELSMLNVKLERERSKVSTLESVLSDSRQECMKLTITKNDLEERLEECEQKSRNHMEFL